MLDLGLTKMALIGAVALVVLGPQRLPRVARMAGALFGRAQRYINDVKAEVAREIELDELRRMKTDFEDAARHVSSTIHNNLRQHETELREAWNTGMPASFGMAGNAAPSAGSAADVESAPVGDSHSNGNGEVVATSAALLNRRATALRRRNWRVKQGAVPLWYKRATLCRSRIQSGAARVAQHTPATLRSRARFF
jgi:sec-independent protein translocase protein TatB